MAGFEIITFHTIRYSSNAEICVFKFSLLKQRAEAKHFSEEAVLSSQQALTI